MTGTILYAEDEPNDHFFLRRAFQRAGFPDPLKTVEDGQEALEYLSGDGPFADRALYPLPSLILLDINMPRKNGLEVLAWIRQEQRFKSLPVLMLTSSEHPADMAKARELGATDYIVKPSVPIKLIELAQSLHARWLSPRIAAQPNGAITP
jgi:CheY-like chemotaxis protein